MEYTILLIVEVLSALGLIGLVLLQQGKGAEAGASFGGGASQTIFGSSGSGNFMTRMTAVFAAVFFLTSLGLAYVSGKAGRGDGLDFSGAIEPGVVTELPIVGAPPVKSELPVVPASGGGASVPSGEAAIPADLPVVPDVVLESGGVAPGQGAPLQPEGDVQ